MKKYYGLMDLQLNGYKGGYAHTDKQELINISVERIVELSENDIEPLKFPQNTMEALEIMEMYEYKIEEVTEEVYNEILANSDLLFLSQVVQLKKNN